MTNFKYPKTLRIGSKQTFKSVFDYKLFAKNDLMTVYIAPNNLKESRFAVSVSSKAAPACARNRLKRIAREAFRLSRYDIPAGFDYLIIYSRSLSKLAVSDIKATALAQVRQGFTALVEQVYKRYEKRRYKEALNNAEDTGVCD